MQIRVHTQNVSQWELAKALTGYILQEGIGDEIEHSLHKSHDHEHEPIPERYMRTLVQKMQEEFRNLLQTLDRNIDAWFAMTAQMPRRAFLRKSKGKHPSNISDAEIEALRRLIEWHFRQAVGRPEDIPSRTQKQWGKAGIKDPNSDFDEWISKSYVAGRLQTILKNGDSYAQMLKLAQKVPLSRVDELALETAKANAARYIVGYGRKMADLAEDMLVERHKKDLNSVIQHYFSGDLTHTVYNAEGFTPQEAEKLLSTNKRVQGWRELSTELKNRFKAVDVGRDWDRIAVSETRYASNLGTLVNIQQEGGGNPQDIYVYYSVHPKACDSCKELYLHPDGTPRLFPLQTIMNNLQETGGMNVGRKASLIGQKGGWLPNALTHPHCQCLPRRFMSQYAEFEPKKEDLVNESA